MKAYRITEPLTEEKALELVASDLLEQLAETLDALERVREIPENIYNAADTAITALRGYLGVWQ